jgi:phosphatidylethanolamine/phosphatidyl-N-methylethanolamine N-methyltransferase
MLAKAIAAAADLGGDVLELGPGTGVVTANLLQRGLAPRSLTAIETDPQFVALLRSRFPGICVLEGDAFGFPALTGTMRFSSIVCGLPLLNYTRPQGTALIAAGLAAMPKGAPFVLFSYGLNPPVPSPSGARVAKAARIWANLPPAAVWLYRTG